MHTYAVFSRSGGVVRRPDNSQRTARARRRIRFIRDYRYVGYAAADQSWRRPHGSLSVAVADIAARGAPSEAGDHQRNKLVLTNALVHANWRA
jgi:ribosomal protein L32E